MKVADLFSKKPLTDEEKDAVLNKVASLANEMINVERSKMRGIQKKILKIVADAEKRGFSDPNLEEFISFTKENPSPSKLKVYFRQFIEKLKDKKDKFEDKLLYKHSSDAQKDRFMRLKIKFILRLYKNAINSRVPRLKREQLIKVGDELKHLYDVGVRSKEFLALYKSYVATCKDFNSQLHTPEEDQEE